MALTQTAGVALGRAYQILGQLTPPDYTLSAGQLSRGIIVLNGVLQSMQSFGPNVFRQTLTALTVTAGSRTVPVPGDVVGIEEARWVISTNPSYERQLGRFQWVDYMQLPTKDAKGPPTLFMFDYQQDSTQLYAWPVTQISGTINCTTIRRATEIIDSSTMVDLPAEWNLALDYLTADALMDDQGMAESDPATADRVKNHAAYWNKQLLNFDRPTSVFMRAYGQPSSGRFRRY